MTTTSNNYLDSLNTTNPIAERLLRNALDTVNYKPGSAANFAGIEERPVSDLIIPDLDKIKSLRAVAVQHYDRITRTYGVMETYELVILERPVNRYVDERLETNPQWTPAIEKRDAGREVVFLDPANRFTTSDVTEVIVLPVYLTQVTEYRVRDREFQAYLEGMVQEAKEDGAIFLGQIPGFAEEQDEMLALHYIGRIYDDYEDYRDRHSSQPLYAALEMTHPTRFDTIRSYRGLQEHVPQVCDEVDFKFSIVKPINKISKFTSWFFPVWDCLRSNCSFCLGNDAIRYKRKRIVVNGKRLDDPEVIRLDEEYREATLKKLKHLRKIATLAFFNTALMTMMPSTTSDDDSLDDDDDNNDEEDISKFKGAPQTQLDD